MTRAQRNRNPGNLKFMKQRGAIGQDDQGFAIFETHIHGWQALVRQIKLDASRKLSIRKFIEKYAPPAENQTKNYCNFICKSLKAKETDSLADYHPAAIAGLIAWFEGYFLGIDNEAAQK